MIEVCLLSSVACSFARRKRRIHLQHILFTDSVPALAPQVEVSSLCPSSSCVPSYFRYPYCLSSPSLVLAALSQALPAHLVQHQTWDS